MVKVQDYPSELISNLKAKKITRQQFIYQMRAWQIAHGINYSCKGSADKDGVYVTYRGIKATIRNGFLCWKNNKAKTPFEFRRQVDFACNKEFNNFKKASNFCGEAYKASLRGDTDRRGEMQRLQIRYLNEAEKWSALWN